MSWYSENGPCNDVVVSTRVRFARNISGYKFPSKMSEGDADKLISDVYSAFITSNSNFSGQFKLYKKKELSGEELLALFEKHLISLDLVRQQLPGACIVSNDETVSVMLCEEDHVRLQVILAGCQIKNALTTATSYEALLAERLSFVHSGSLGYLTSCPTNIGSGLRISVMLHLPALTMTKRMAGILNSVGKLGLTVRGMYGEGTSAGGALYQLSNQVTLGITPEEIEKKLSDVLSQIITLEQKARNAILSQNEVELKNRCMRAFGTLKNSYALTSEEMLSGLSDIRLGKALGLVDTEYSAVSRLLVEGSRACMAAQQGLSEPTARDVRRAEMAKEIL